MTFDDVEGIDEAEEELVEIVDFLKNPDRYRVLGAAIPKGVLLSGPARHRQDAARARRRRRGRRAVLLAQRVGVHRDGRRRRRLAASATCSTRPRRPPRRSSSSTSSTPSAARAARAPSAATDEREQTLNQILTEMDGFTGSEGVIVIAATNRPEVLDSALLRPGRFDRRVVVNPPDKDGRRKILDVHTRSVPLADDVDLDAIAATTPGHGRRRPAQPHQRGGPHGRPARPREGPARRLHRRAGADHPRRRAADHAVDRGARAHRLPRVRPRRARHARAGRRPGPQGLDRARAAARSASRSSRPRATATATTSATCAAASSARSAGAPPRRSSTATSRPARSPTSSRSRASPARWSAAGACRTASAS